LYKIFKSRKGISPILATLLLIVIAVAAVIVTYAWVMTFTSTQTQQAGAILQVVNKNFNSTAPKTIEITLLNSGTADAKIADVYVGTSATSLVKQTSVAYNPSSKIMGANGKSIVITITYDWTSGTRYYFNIVTEAGQQVPFNEQP